MVVPLEPGRPSEARQLLRTRRSCAGGRRPSHDDPGVDLAQAHVSGHRNVGGRSRPRQI